MKTKLLKRLHKKCSWTCIRKDFGGVVMDEWILLQDGLITYHSSSEALIKHMFEMNSIDYDSAFDWNWRGILRDYIIKTNERKFRKYKKRS